MAEVMSSDIQGIISIEATSKDTTNTSLGQFGDVTYIYGTGMYTERVSALVPGCSFP